MPVGLVQLFSGRFIFDEFLIQHSQGVVAIGVFDRMSVDVIGIGVVQLRTRIGFRLIFLFFAGYANTAKQQEE